jgi:thymidylate kinase
MTVVIFEGADGVGKTTLARQFSVALGYPIVKLRWDLEHEEAQTVAYAKATLGLLSATRASHHPPRAAAERRLHRL